MHIVPEPVNMHTWPALRHPAYLDHGRLKWPVRLWVRLQVQGTNTTSMKSTSLHIRYLAPLRSPIALPQAQGAQHTGQPRVGRLSMQMDA